MDHQALVDVGIPAVVVFLMALVGLRIGRDDFRRVLERPRLVGVAVVAQPLLLPPLAGAVGWLAGVGPPVIAALVLIAACPAGVLSNVYALVAGGTAALSITLTAAGTLLSVFTLPLVTALGFALIPGHDELAVSVPLSRTAADLFLTILVPVGLGMAARSTMQRHPRLERGLQAAGALATLTLVGILLVTQWSTVAGELIRLSLAVLAFSVTALLLAHLLAGALGAARADRVAFALEFPGRNLGAAAVVGVHSLGRPDIAGLATAVFIVQVPLMFVVSLLIRRSSP